MRLIERESSDDGALLRWRKCEVCGQLFDTTNTDEVFHHDIEHHEPMRDD